MHTPEFEPTALRSQLSLDCYITSYACALLCFTQRFVHQSGSNRFIPHLFFTFCVFLYYTLAQLIFCFLLYKLSHFDFQCPSSRSVSLWLKTHLGKFEGELLLVRHFFSVYLILERNQWLLFPEGRTGHFCGFTDPSKSKRKLQL